MGHKTLELTLISGKDLKNVSLMGGKMDVYVVASISGDPHSKQKTPTHEDGGTSPCWNHTLRFNFDESTAVYSGWEVHLLLRHDALGPDKDIGEVKIPIKDLISSYNPKSNDEPQFVTYQVRSKSSGKGRGELRLSYRIKDAPSKAAKAPAAVPYPPQMASGSAYQQPYPPHPHPQQGTAYAYPASAAPGYPAPPAGYPQYGGYPQQQPAPGGYGYGYPAQGGYPMQQKPQKPKKGGGSGFGMGLLGGAVGGLILGEMMEDSFDGDF